ncbi:MAG: hypothetical protein IT320_17415 [Anaerolineae bacterium]|nr:hypothetical protein [Anaerolineae bacterium]
MTDDLDALRHFDEEDDYGFDEDSELGFDPPAREEKRFLGMTAIERMFLSIFLFLNVVVIGMALLIATGRIRF